MGCCSFVFGVGSIVNFVCLLFPTQYHALQSLQTFHVSHISIYDWSIFNSAQLKFKWIEGLPYGVLIQTSAHEFAAQE